MRRLLIIRHGQTLENAQDRMVSTSDPSLSPSGMAQVEALAESLSHVQMTRIISSPMLRCRQTTEALARRQPATTRVDFDEKLCELRFGEIEGLSPAEIAERGLGEMFVDWRQGRPPRYPVGAETFDNASTRLSAVYDDAIADLDGCVVLVGHSHALRILLAVSVLGVAPEAHRRMKLDHGAVTEVRWEGAVARLTALNARTLSAD